MKKIPIKYHENLKVWPFVEAFKIIDRFGGLENFNKHSKNTVWSAQTHR